MKIQTRTQIITIGIFFVLVMGLLPYSSSVAADDLDVYTDSLASGWANWSWDTTVNLSNSAPVHGGTRAIAVTYTAGWAGFYLHANSAINLSGYQRLRFFINGGTTGNQKIHVVANGNGGGAFEVSAPTNSWTQVDIPLSELGSPSSLSDLYWQDTTGGTQPTFYLDDIKLIASAGPPPSPGAGPTLSIDVAAGRHAISEDIYGMNYADEQLAAQLRLPVRRWGGNSTSRYNWQTNMHSTGSDWYYENIPDGSNVTNGSASDLFVEQDRRTGTKTIMTVPLIGWTPKNDSPRAHPYACGFKVSRYGTQQSTDSSWDSDCGNGVYANGSSIIGNDPADTSSQIGTPFVTAWINHLKGRYGTAANGGVAYYNLDNEPMLWNSTHRDVHPQPTTYNEMRDRTYEYASAVKTADPSGKTLGPVLWGWCAYFFSAQDGCSVGTDYTSHGNTAFVPWYLQQMKAYEQQNSTRILDYLDLHYYPQANGVALSSAGNTATQALRLRTTKSLWDLNYTDESWIGSAGWESGKVKLIPRMKEWVNNNYANTKLAITEYNWGALDHINGALAQADVLGIFGREGLDLATLWGPPSLTQPGAFAFRMYRNYDGSGHGFGDTSVQALSTDQDTMSIYAAQRGTDKALTIIVINKTGNTLTSSVNLSGITPVPAAKAYQYSTGNLNGITALADQTVTKTGFTSDFPANSITLFVVMPTASILPPTNLRIIHE